MVGYGGDSKLYGYLIYHVAKFKTHANHSRSNQDLIFCAISCLRTFKKLS
jgi:hypothetical protein